VGAYYTDSEAAGAIVLAADRGREAAWVCAIDDAMDSDGAW